MMSSQSENVLETGDLPASERRWTALPAARDETGTTLATAFRRRRSTRQFIPGSLSLREVAQLLWAAQGVTHGDGKRTVPSAGALYPLETYVVSVNVADLPAGLYRYDPQAHALEQLAAGDLRATLYEAALAQDAVGQAAAILVVAAVFARTTGKYGARGHQYVHAEVGALAQNVALQTVPLGLGTVYVGAFHDEAVQAALGVPENAVPICLLPVGRLD